MISARKYRRDACVVLLRWAAVASLGALLVACGTTNGAGPAASGDVTDQEALTRVTRLLELRADHEPGPVVWASLLNSLPGRAPSNAGDLDTEAIVVGTVTSAAPGGAFVIKGGMDSPVPFETTEVAGRYAEVTLEVSETMGRSGHIGREVRFQFLIDTVEDVETVSRGFTAMGPMVVFLDAAPTNPPGVYDITWPGALLSPITDKGRLLFPAMREWFDANWFAGIDTLKELRAAAAEA